MKGSMYDKLLELPLFQGLSEDNLTNILEKVKVEFKDFDNIPLKFWGFVAGGGFFLFFYLMSFVLFGKEGLGFGDVKLMACAGLLIGWQAIIISVVVAVFFALLSIIVSKACVRETPATQDTSVESTQSPKAR